MSTEPSGRQILDTPMDGDNDAEAHSIREYLVELVAKMWADGEGFSGKRPFGNSGWTWELYKALIVAGHVRGTLDEDGYVEDLSRDEEARADRLISRAIEVLKLAPEAAR
jgi:hypothetical protein